MRIDNLVKLTVPALASLEACTKQEYRAVFLFTKVTQQAFPYKLKYKTRYIKGDTEIERRDLAYIPLENFDSKAKLCIAKLKELNFNLDYGIARDSMEYLKANGLFYL